MKKFMQLAGQLSIFDYLSEINAKKSFYDGSDLCQEQIVFLIEKGSIVKYEVYGIYDVDNVDTVILMSCDTTAPLFNHVPLSELGKTLFESLDKAEAVLLKQLDDCDCIMASDMNVRSFQAFKAFHRNGTLLIAFYAELDNGYVYMKDYFNCGHLVKISTEDAERLLNEQIESYPYKASPEENFPRLANMYRTKNADNWEYAELGCPLTIVS